MPVAARTCRFAYTVVNDQPAVFGQDGRSTCADFEPLPWRHRSRQTVMRCEPAQTLRFRAIQRGRTIGNPDALVIEIHFTGLTMASSFFWTSAGKERTVEHAQLQVPRGVRDRDREE